MPVAELQRLTFYAVYAYINLSEKIKQKKETICQKMVMKILAAIYIISLL